MPAHLSKRGSHFLHRRRAQPGVPDQQRVQQPVRWFVVVEGELTVPNSSIDRSDRILVESFECITECAGSP